MEGGALEGLLSGVNSSPGDILAPDSVMKASR
jgi:hypothetical protein